MSLCINPHCKNPQNSHTLLFCTGCGSELLIDGRYRAIGELGQGGFGITYEVLDLNSQPKVLKVLMDNHPKYTELFRQEADVLGILDHPGIPKLDEDGYFLYFPNGAFEPLHCLVMEKIEGLNLAEYIHQRGDRPIRQKRALRWLAELALILEQVHDHDFFHRDIKPANIMLRANGLLALIDFGTARQIDSNYEELQAAGAITGVMTAGYTPMEQMRGRASRQSDFYALGGTMIFLLTTRNPSYFYQSHNNRINWRGAVTDILPRFADLIDRLVEPLPQDRPQTARDIFNEIAIIEPSLQGLNEYFLSGSMSRIVPNEPTSSIPATPKQNIPNSGTTPTPNTQKSEPTFIAPSPTGDYPQGTLRKRHSQPLISQEFIGRCRQELAEFIGPMANIVCERTLAQNPNISQTEFVRALAQKIPNGEQAEEFKRRLL